MELVSATLKEAKIELSLGYNTDSVWRSVAAKSVYLEKPENDADWPR
jgi:hypothetical protein